MASLAVPAEKIRQFAGQLAKTLDPKSKENVKVVDKGDLLYSQGMVRSPRLFGEKIIAIVQDVTPVQVNLNLKHPLLSMCSCPQSGFCRHMMAVFFAVYSDFENVYQWQTNWKAEIEIDADTTAIKQETLKVTKPVDLYEFWTNLVDQTFFEQFANPDSYFPFVMDAKGMAVLRQLSLSRPAKPSTAAFYDLVVHLHLLNKFLTLFSESKYSLREFEDTCKTLMATIFHRIEEAIKELPRPIPFVYEPVLKSAKNELHEILYFDAPFQKGILSIYWNFWTKLFKNTIERKDERELAEDLARKGNPNSTWSICYSFQLVLNKQTKQATELLETAGQAYFEYVFFWMEFFALNSYWNQFEEMVPYFLKYCKTFFNKLPYGSAIQYRRQTESYFYSYCSNTGNTTLYERVLLQMVPYSTRRLVEFYFEQREFRKMVEFLEFSNTGLQNIDNSQLKVIQAEDPECILPLYHREIHRNIAQKNRQSYRVAVRYLKKLRALYKKLKKQETWQLYFENILKDTKRLRAFQEELQRGKLIDV